MLDINLPSVQSEVLATFNDYERALMANDVSTLSMLFWDSPLTVRFGDREALYGYDAIAAFRRAYVPFDLSRVVERVVITTYGSDMATTAAEVHYTESGQWGRQTQTWLRTHDGWRVVAAHVSRLILPST